MPLTVSPNQHFCSSKADFHRQRSKFAEWALPYTEAASSNSKLGRNSWANFSMSAAACGLKFSLYLCFLAQAPGASLLGCAHFFQPIFRLSAHKEEARLRHRAHYGKNGTGKTPPIYVLTCIKHMQLLCPITTLLGFWDAPSHIIAIYSNTFALSEALLLQKQ